jgi:hypothetical protein
VNCEGHKLYNPDNNSTSARISDKLTLPYYADGSMVNGSACNDGLVPPLAGSPRPIRVRLWELQPLIPHSFLWRPFNQDVLLGLVFIQVSTYGTPRYLKIRCSRMRQKISLFFKLGTSRSELFFGGTNRGKIKWVPLANEVILCVCII